MEGILNNHLQQRKAAIMAGFIGNGSISTTDRLQKSNDDELRKGGEGSKGGKVIGHTKSGKPIYSNKTAGDYKDFTKQDHFDAHSAHSEKHENHKKSSESKDENTDVSFHSEASKKHYKAGSDHYAAYKDASEEKKSKSIYGKGDKIILQNQQSNKLGTYSHKDEESDEHHHIEINGKTRRVHEDYIVGRAKEKK